MGKIIPFSEWLMDDYWPETKKPVRSIKVHKRTKPMKRKFRKGRK